MVLDDGQMIPGDELDLNFLTFGLKLGKNPGKNLNQEIDLNDLRVCSSGQDGTV